jgi:hypothetical protein
MPFWVNQLEEVERRVGAYLDKRLAASAAAAQSE